MERASKKKKEKPIIPARTGTKNLLHIINLLHWFSASVFKKHRHAMLKIAQAERAERRKVIRLCVLSVLSAPA